MFFCFARPLLRMDFLSGVLCRAARGGRGGVVEEVRGPAYFRSAAPRHLPLLPTPAHKASSKFRAAFLDFLHILNTHAPMFLWRTSLFFCEIGTHMHRGNHSWYFSCGCHYLFPLAHLFEARLVFSGRSPLGYDVLLYLCCLALSCAPFFSAGSLLGTF